MDTTTFTHYYETLVNLHTEEITTPDELLYLHEQLKTVIEEIKTYVPQSPAEINRKNEIVYKVKDTLRDLIASSESFLLVSEIEETLF